MRPDLRATPIERPHKKQPGHLPEFASRSTEFRQAFGESSLRFGSQPSRQDSFTKRQDFARTDVAFGLLAALQEPTQISSDKRLDPNSLIARILRGTYRTWAALMSAFTTKQRVEDQLKNNPKPPSHLDFKG
jgi:hypothetical protein